MYYDGSSPASSSPGAPYLASLRPLLFRCACSCARPCAYARARARRAPVPELPICSWHAPYL
eukprot:12399499-Karenia_brevis.AAC.1